MLKNRALKIAVELRGSSKPFYPFDLHIFKNCIPCRHPGGLYLCLYCVLKLYSKYTLFCPLVYSALMVCLRIH